MKRLLVVLVTNLLKAITPLTAAYPGKLQEESLDT